MNHLIFLVHKIYEALESRKEVRAVFLDINKAFDGVGHAGLLCKLEALGVQSPLLQWFEGCLRNRVRSYRRAMLSLTGEQSTLEFLKGLCYTRFYFLFTIILLMVSPLFP